MLKTEPLVLGIRTFDPSGFNEKFINYNKMGAILIATPPQEHLIYHYSKGLHLITAPWLLWNSRFQPYGTRLRNITYLYALPFCPADGSDMNVHYFRFHNVTGQGTICFGNAFAIKGNQIDKSSSVQEIFQKLFVAFWGSKFNHDYNESGYNYWRTGGDASVENTSRRSSLHWLRHSLLMPEELEPALLSEEQFSRKNTLVIKQSLPSQVNDTLALGKRGN